MSPSPSPAIPARRRGSAAPPAAALLVFAVGLAGLAAPLAAQSGLGGAPDGGPVIPTKESFEESLKDAPWVAGSWRFQPWLGLRDASFVTNQVSSSDSGAQDDGERDFTLSAGAGLRAYYAKSKLLFTVHVLPEYVWWQDNEDKRHLNGRYGAALFGYFNRLRFGLSSRLLEQQNFFSREVQQLTSTSLLENRLQVEVDLTRGIAAYGYGEATTSEGNADDLALFRTLDREEQAFGVGLRLFSPRGWSARVGLEERQIDFEGGARNLSSDGSLVEVGLGYRRRRLEGHLTVRFEEREPRDGSELESYSDVGGSFQLQYQPSERFELAAFASRAFDYSVDGEFSHYISELEGARARIKSQRGSFGIFAAIGQDEYERLGDGDNRFDDVTELGAQLDFRLRRLLIVGISVLRRDYDSTDDFFDRDVTSFGLSLQLGEVAERLRFGNDRSAW